MKPQIWLFHVVVLLTTAKKGTKMKNARAERAKLLFFLTKMQICDVLVAVAVVVAKAPFPTPYNGDGNGDVWWEKTIALHALHVRFSLLSISLPSSAKQQRELAKFEVL